MRDSGKTERPETGPQPGQTRPSKRPAIRSLIRAAGIGAALALFLAATAACQPDTPALPSPTPEAVPTLTPRANSPTATAAPPEIATAEKPTPANAARGTGPAPRTPPPTEGQAAAPDAPASPDPVNAPKNEAGELTQEPTDQPGPPRDPELIRQLVAQLPPSAQECLPPAVAEGKVETDITAAASARHVQVLDNAAQCLTNQEIARLMILPAFSAEMDLTQAEKACIEESNSGSMVRKSLNTRGAYPRYMDAAYFTVAGTMLNLIECAGFQRVNTMLQIRPQELDILTCTIANGREAEDWLDQLIDSTEDATMRYEARSYECSRNAALEPRTEEEN